MPKQTKVITVLFIAHEFGYYNGHGGIASYLYNITEFIVKNTNYNVHVISNMLYPGELVAYDNFSYHLVKGNLDKIRHSVCELAQKIQPNYIECADYLAFGLYLSKLNLKNCCLVTNIHTASKECFEWSTKQSISNAPHHIIDTYEKEKEQMQNSHFCICPSNFLANYMKKTYNLDKDIHVIPNYMPYNTISKQDIYNKVSSRYDIKEYHNTFNISLITRFEPRKNHELLLQSFIKFLEKVPKANLIMAGNETDNTRFSIIKNTPRKYVNNIHIFDFLEKEQHDLIAAISDVVILPSVFENQPMAMIESCLKEIPVIASIYSGCKDYIKNPNMLFDPFSPDSLDKCINYCYKLSKEQRKIEAANQKTKLLSLLKPESSVFPRFTLCESIIGNNNIGFYKGLYHE